MCYHDAPHAQVADYRFNILLSTLVAQAWATSKVVVISLDSCKPAIVQQLLASGDLNPNKGLGLLLTRGAFASGSMTASPSLTAPQSHCPRDWLDWRPQRCRSEYVSPRSKPVCLDDQWLRRSNWRISVLPVGTQPEPDSGANVGSVAQCR